MPATDATMNADCQPNLKASHGTTAGASSAPALVPALNRLVAKARSDLGNQRATALMADGKFPPSPNPRAERTTRNPARPPTKACAAAARLHAIIDTV